MLNYVMKYSNRDLLAKVTKNLAINIRFVVIKARCTPEQLTILTKHSKTFFFNHVVKNIVNYQLQKLYLKWTSIKGSNYAFATWCHSAQKISVAFTCVLANVQVKLL